MPPLVPAADRLFHIKVPIPEFLFVECISVLLFVTISIPAPPDIQRSRSPAIPWTFKVPASRCSASLQAVLFIASIPLPPILSG